MQEKRRWWEFTSAMLHILAMLFMLSDHAWSLLFPTQRWMTGIGRMAFPIFAFMLVEGYHYTHDFKKYLKRMVIFALISEIPFNLMMGGSFIGPYHQNVMVLFIIGLLGMRCIDWIREKKKLWLTILLSFLIIIVCYVLSIVTFADYFSGGILMIFTFYFFRGKKWWCYLGQFLCMYWINVEFLGGLCYIVNIFGQNIEIVEQGIALFSLIPIWLYRGKQGYHSKPFQYLCYGFYPVHMLVLYLVGMLVY